MEKRQKVQELPTTIQEQTIKTNEVTINKGLKQVKKVNVKN